MGDVLWFIYSGLLELIGELVDGSGIVLMELVFSYKLICDLMCCGYCI